MTRKIPKLPVATLALLCLSVATPAALPSTGPPSLEALLTAFQETRAATETLQASFEELKEISLLREPVVQRGTFYHSRPQNFLWDYKAPRPKQILLTSEVLLAYYPDLNRAEEVNVRRWTRQIRRYLNVGEDLESLRRDYEIALAPADDNELEGTYLLVLEPRGRRLKARLRELRLWIDSESSQTRRVSYLDANGDRTTYTFRDIRINAAMDPDRFQIELPRDVEMGETFSGFTGR